MISPYIIVKLCFPQVENVENYQQKMDKSEAETRDLAFRIQLSCADLFSNVKSITLGIKYMLGINYHTSLGEFDMFLVVPEAHPSKFHKTGK